MEKGVFVRTATGLARELNWVDMFIMNIVAVAFGVSLVEMYAFQPSLYPGANLLLAFLIAGIIFVFLGLAVSFSMVAMPRSGGDYVFNSRAVHPVFGLLGSWIYWFLNWENQGILAWVTVAYMFSTAVGSVGAAFNDPNLMAWGTRLTEPTWTISLGTLIILFGLVAAMRNKWYAWIQRVLFTIAMLGVFVLAIAFAATPNVEFISKFDAFAAQYGTSYQGIIDAAVTQGHTMAPFSIPATWLAALFMFGWFSIWPIILAGEVKDVKKSMIWGNVGGTIAAMILYIVVGALFYNSVGETFAVSASWLGYNSPENYKLPMLPFMQYLVAIIIPNPWVVGFVGVSLALWGILLYPNFIIIGSRYQFAWAFDRVIPKKFAEVNDRLHTPIFGNVFYAILAWIVLVILATIGNIFVFAVNVSLYCGIYFMFCALGAAVFPYTKKDMFEASPGFSKSRIAGIPVITIVGLISLVSMVYATVTYIIHPELSGPVNINSAAFLVGLEIIALIIYSVSKYYYKTKGLDVSRAFREIPPV